MKRAGKVTREIALLALRRGYPVEDVADAMGLSARTIYRLQSQAEDSAEKVRGECRQLEAAVDGD